MSKHTLVLEKALPEIDLFRIESPRESSRSAPHPTPNKYDKLAAGLFRPESLSRRSVIAFCSTQTGAGVTSIVRGVANSLSSSGKAVGVFDDQLDTVYFDGASEFAPSPNEPVSILGAPNLLKSHVALARITELRDRFECVLIDCGPVETNAGFVRLASSCDGVVLIAEAGRSSRKQLKRAQQMVQMAKGNLLGVVLNKRRYPIPSWLHKAMRVS